MTWQSSASMFVGRVTCPDANTLVIPVTATGRVSAIDKFYASTHQTLTQITPDFLQIYGSDIAGLLFVGLISSTEDYFRNILGFILSVCPKARAHAADEKVQLGSLLWAKDYLQNRSAFEFMAFSSADSIRKALANFACHQVQKASAVEGMLKEYDKLCELRHAVVHSGHIVAGKNAIKLALRHSGQPLKVALNYGGLQATGTVCTALVQAANKELFEALVARWAQDWRQLASWDATHETKLFRKIRSGFLSTRDYRNGAIPRISAERLLDQVRQTYNL
jgi:hypothetical protein